MNLQQIALRIRGAHELPGLSATGHKLLRMIGDPDVTMQRIAAVVALDPPLAGGVMRVANSAAYGFGEPTRDLGTAVTRIGLRMLKTLTVATSVLRNVESLGRVHELQRSSYWRHCLATGIGARLVAHSINPFLDEDVFLAGLLHGVGITVLDVFFPEEMRKVLAAADSNRISLGEAMPGVIGLQLAEVSLAMLREWEIEAGVISTIENGLLGKCDTEEEHLRGSCLKLGMSLAQAVGIGLPTHGPERELDRLRKEVAIDDEMWMKMYQRVTLDFRVFEGLALGKAA